MEYQLASGEKIRFHPNKIGTGGEGNIWRTDRNGFLAKTYHKANQENLNKIKAMISNSPSVFIVDDSHVPIAWPQEILFDKKQNFQGFLLPEVKDSTILFNVYHFGKRKKTFPAFTWRDLHIIALHLVSIIDDLHSQNYVIGDLKPENILVNKHGLVSLIDTDSFQINDSLTGKIYLGTVASPELTAPEILNENLLTVGRSKLQDCFSLAIIVWLLLFGYHPFNPSSSSKEDSKITPDIDENIRSGLWRYHSKNYDDSKNIIFTPFEALHPRLQKCFRQCFSDGHTEPRSRPSAHEWGHALIESIEALSNCENSSSHYYVKSHNECYWCARYQQLGDELFVTHDFSLEKKIKRNFSKIKDKIENPQSLEEISKKTEDRIKKKWLEKRKALAQLAEDTKRLNSEVKKLDADKICVQEKVADKQRELKDLELELGKCRNKVKDTERQLHNYNRQYRVRTAQKYFVRILLFLVFGGLVVGGFNLGLIGLRRIVSEVSEAVGGVYESAYKKVENVFADKPTSQAAYNFPRPECGDEDPNVPSDWYPVYVVVNKDNQAEMFNLIKNEFCQDVTPPYKTAAGQQRIQVASFLTWEKAQEFSERMKLRVGNAEVGRPSRKTVNSP